MNETKRNKKKTDNEMDYHNSNDREVEKVKVFNNNFHSNETNAFDPGQSREPGMLKVSIEKKTSKQ